MDINKSDGTVVRPGKISDVFEARVGARARCPKCSNNSDFTVFLGVDVVSATVTAAISPKKNWRIGMPNLGRMQIKDVRCTQCGYRESPSKFSTNGDNE